MIDIYALDANYDICAIISSNNVQWNRKYYECGDFSIQISAGDYSSDMKYIYINGRKELGMIISNLLDSFSKMN